MTEGEKDSVAEDVSETINELEDLLAGTSTWSANASGARSQTEDRGWWSPFRWLWTGDGYASDEVLEAALIAGGNSYFENVPAVHATLERGSLLDPTGLMNATDQVLCDIEEGKSLAEAGGNAFVTLTYERFSDKAAGRLPTPGGDPADKVGFTRKARDNYEGYEGWTPKKRDRIHPPKRREHTRPPQQVVQGGKILNCLERLAEQ